jgi:hypothetical protein
VDWWLRQELAQATGRAAHDLKIDRGKVLLFQEAGGSMRPIGAGSDSGVCPFDDQSAPTRAPPFRQQPARRYACPVAPRHKIILTVRL